MTSISRLLRLHELTPLKGLGQHFLTAQGSLDKIVAAAELTPEDVVLEIGAGLGTLTRALAEVAGRVVAVEIDSRLIPVLYEELDSYGNVQIVEGDILSIEPGELIGSSAYKVVANLPYSITSAVLRHLLEAQLPPRTMVVTVQREVAERIVARGGRMSLLAVSIQFYGRPRLLFRIKPGAFHPPPSVESAVVRIDRHTQQPVPVADTAAFFRIARAGFSQPRKQIRNSLAGSLGLAPQQVASALEQSGLNYHQRAERLRLDDWADVLNALKPLMPEFDADDV
jgi:16S rRNA (adenine1518-N6/adenine1519-N6)-dimethyltransferase